MVAVGGVFCHGGEYHGIHVDSRGRGEVRDEIRGRGGVFLDVLVGHGEGGFAFKRWLAGDQFVHDAASGVNIGTRIGGLAAGLLRGEILGGADDCGGLSHGGGGIVDRAGDAKVHDFHATGVGDHDVGGFHIAVNNAGVMGCLQRFTHRDEDVGCLNWGEYAVFGDNFAQVSAPHTFHHDIRNRGAVFVYFAGVKNSDD